MGVRKFWSVALSFGKVVCVVKVTTPLYINCKENHFANSKDCETLKAAKLVRSTNLEGSIEE